MLSVNPATHFIRCSAQYSWQIRFSLSLSLSLARSLSRSLFLSSACGCWPFVLRSGFPCNNLVRVTEKILSPAELVPIRPGYDESFLFVFFYPYLDLGFLPLSFTLGIHLSILFFLFDFIYFIFFFSFARSSRICWLLTVLSAHPDLTA